MSEPIHPPAPRRDFLKRLGASGAVPLAQGLALGGLGSVAGGASAAGPAAPAVTMPAPQAGYISLSQDEAAFVETLVNLMCPADALSPNGVDCGLAVFIDRQLAGEFGKGARRYNRGPWQRGTPQQGVQLPMTPEQFFKAGVEVANSACMARHGRLFDALSQAQADAVLNDLADGRLTDPRLPMATWFNELVYPLFNQACFSDPVYGGNVGKVFWKMIGYPGLPATHTVNVLQYRGKPFPAAADPKSMADFS